MKFGVLFTCLLFLTPSSMRAIDSLSFITAALGSKIMPNTQEELNELKKKKNSSPEAKSECWL